MKMFLRKVTRRGRPGVGPWCWQCPRNRFTALVLLTVTAVAAAGCISTARMAVPLALASAPAWPVSGRQGWKLNEKVPGSPLTLDQPSGYTISLGDRDLAAVEVIGDGMVRFADGMDPALEPIVAGTAAALLLVVGAVGNGKSFP